MEPLKLDEHKKPIIPDKLPEGAVKVDAKAGQFLCEIAVKHFPDCTETRKVNTHLTDKPVLDKDDPVVIPPKEEKNEEGETETEVKSLVKNYPPAFVKFVGQKTTEFEKKTDTGLKRLGISNYVTNKAEINGRGIKEDFFTEYGVTTGSKTAKEQATWADPDHFRIEVYDNRAYKDGDAEVKVELQGLQPFYKRETENSKTYIVRDKTKTDDDSAADVRPEPGFKIPDEALRKLEVKCKKVPEHSGFYRSKYLRLVTHKKDQEAATENTLYVGGYYDETGLTADERRYTEILEQKVRARYTPKMCTEKKCRAEAVAEIGELKKEVVFSVNIFDSACEYEDVRRTIYGEVRRVYAQADIRPVINEVIKYPPPQNILLIGTGSGTTPLASGVVSGTTKSTITVKISGQTNDVTLNPTKDHTAKQVTEALCNKIKANPTGSDPKLYTRVVVEPPSTSGSPAPEPKRSRYIMVCTDSACRTPATITSATSDDSRLPAVQAISITQDQLKNVPASDSDKLFRRLLMYSRTDPHYLDVVAIPSFKTETYNVGMTTYTSTTFGMAMWVYEGYGCSFFIASGRIKETPHDTRYSFSHELGHVLWNGGHVVLRNAGEGSDPAEPDRRDQLMMGGGDMSGDAAKVTGRRRIMDAPLEIPYHAKKADGGKYKIKKMVSSVEVEVETNDVTLKDGTPVGTAVSRCSQFASAPALRAPSPKREVATEW